MTKLVTELKAQDLKVLSFINEIFIMFINKQKGLDLNSYKNKLINHFNYTLDSHNHLKKIMMKPSTSSNNIDMQNDYL